MTWKERMYAGLGEYLRSLDVDAVTVVDFEDRTQWGGFGGCNSYSYEETVCDLTYLRADGTVGTYTYDGSFADLVNGIS